MSAERRERARALLGEHGADALLVTKQVNVRWLTGFTGSAGDLLLGASAAEDVLVTDGRYTEQAAEQAPGLALRDDRTDGWLAQRLGPGACLAVESHVLTWDRLRALEAALPGVEFAAAGGCVEQLRAIKDAGELALLTQACAITATALEAVTAWLAPGATEIDIARDIEQEMRAQGADDRAFATIVASGPNGARPHHRPTERAVARGDLVTIDVGALVGGYHADMTRTVAVGEPPRALRDAYEVVRRAQADAVAAVRDGVAAGEIDATARAVITQAGHGQHLAHPVGHAVGLEIHEQPILRVGEPATLRTGMTVTVEPGAYITGLGGIRIEDVVVVTGTGCTVLTDATRELVVL